MALPQAVKKQAEAAHKLQEELIRAQEAQRNGQEQEPVPAQQGQQDAADEAGQQQGQETGGQDEGRADAQFSAGEERQGEEGQVEPWEQRYKVLEGKYRAEVPRMARELRDTKAQIEQLQSLLAAMPEARQAAEKPAEETPADFRFVTDEEVTDYGSDFLDVVARKAKETFMPELERVRRENQELRQLLGGVQKKFVMSDREKLYGFLDSHLENWRDVNQDEGFLQWLDETDPYTGYQRHQLLRSAFDQNNGQRVLAFFTGFLRENAAVTPSDEAPQPRQPQQSLETMVAPGTAQSAGTVDAPRGRSKKVWAQHEVAAFYADVQKGKFRTDPKAKERIERDIIAAAQEGRIR